MQVLASHEGIETLTEDSFNALAREYFRGKAGIQEIDEQLQQYEKDRKNLPPLQAFEHYNDYLFDKGEHDAFEELVGPSIVKLKEERQRREQHLGIIADILKKHLPQDIWFRHMDTGIRVIHVCKSECDYPPYTDKSAKYHVTREEYNKIPYGRNLWIQVKPWYKIKTIPKTVTRHTTKMKTDGWTLEKSYRTGFLSHRLAITKGVLIGVPGIVGTIAAFDAEILMAMTVTIPLALAFPYFALRDLFGPH